MPTSDQKMKQRMDDLLETIKTNPGQSAVQLTAYCSFYFGVSRNTIKEYIETLKTAGIVRADASAKLYPVEAMQV